MKNLNYLYIILAGILWGLIGLFTSRLSDGGMTSQDLVAIRAIGAVIVLGMIEGIKDSTQFKINLRDIKYFVGTGIISFVGFNWCYFTCIKECSLSVAVILLYTSPIFVVLLSALLFKEKLTKRKACALLLAVAGCCLVTGIVGELKGSVFGIICGIGSGLFYGLYSIFGRYALNKYTSGTVTFYTFVLAALGSLFMCNIINITQYYQNIDMIFYTLLLVIISTVLPFELYTKGLKGVESGVAAILATVEPVVGVLVGVFVLGDNLSLSGGLGVIFIIFAIFILK